jgi:hypothetical protein
VPALNQLANKQYDETNTYADLVHFIHLYVVEPHPKGPDDSPYSGQVWEAEYSTKGQAFTYNERVSAAQDMIPLLGGNQLMLVDDLVPGNLNNPAWCTYGPCPNCAYLIGQDGVIDTAQTWFNAGEMETAIDRLLGGS